MDLVAIFQSWRLSQSMRLPSAVRFYFSIILHRTYAKLPRRRHLSYPNKIPSSPKARAGRHLYHAVHLLLHVSLRIKRKGPPLPFLVIANLHLVIWYLQILSNTIVPHTHSPGILVNTHNLGFYSLFLPLPLHPLLYLLEIRPISCGPSHRLGDLLIVELVAEV